MIDLVFTPESGESRIQQSPSLYQQVEQSFTKQSFQPQGTEQTSLKDLGFPKLDLYDAKAQPSDSFVKTSAPTPQDQAQFQPVQAQSERHPLQAQSERHPVADRHAPGQDMSARELQLGMMAKALNINITKNRDGSYDVTSPLDNPQQAASGILNKVFSGFMGRNDGSSPVGMNPWHARAWQGFPEDPGQRQQEDARRRQEEQQAKQRWERSGK